MVWREGEVEEDGERQGRAESDFGRIFGKKCIGEGGDKIMRVDELGIK